MNRYLSILLVGTAVLLSSCADKASIKQALLDDPEILYQALQKDPGRFMQVLETVSREGRKVAMERQKIEEDARVAEQLKNPIKLDISAKRAVEGNRSAPIQVVAFSDFQCPYCQRGFQTVQELKKKYGNRMVFVMKHLPLDFHPLAMPAAKRFEAIAMQDGKKAYKFHDELFTNQQALGKGGEKFLDSLVTKVGANLAQVKKDMNSKEVETRIKTDMEEARKNGIEGTPTFVVAGVVLRGAQPASSFEEIINKRDTASKDAGE